jgi:hypothetical protein
MRNSGIHVAYGYIYPLLNSISVFFFHPCLIPHSSSFTDSCLLASPSRILLMADLSASTSREKQSALKTMVKAFSFCEAMAFIMYL